MLLLGLFTVTAFHAAPAGTRLHVRPPALAPAARMLIEPSLYTAASIYDADMEQKMAELKVELEKATAMALLITEAQAATARAESQLSDARSTIALLETSQASQATLIDSLNARVKDADADASALRVELASSSGSVASLESALGQQQVEQAAVRQELAAERAALEAEKAANAAAEAAKTALRMEKSIAAAEAAKLAVNLASTRASAAAEQVRLVGELEAADATNAEYLKAIQEIATKCATLTNQVQATTNE